MNYEELRLLTFDALRKYEGDNIQTRIIINQVSDLATSKGSSLQRNDRDKLVHLVSDLIVEGVLGWGLNYDNPDPPFMHISEYGRTVLDAGIVQPYDPDGYLAYLKTQAQNIDDIILIYITEALQTFRHNNLLSAAVMTGVASERAFDLLLESTYNALTNPDQQKKFEKLLDSTRTKEKFDEVKKAILKIRSNLPKEINETLESGLDGVFNLIRITRNDAGHPTGKTVRREQVFVNLQLFVPYCRCVYSLINYLKNNPI
jgi:hypothetical protein